jgi:hypothetical protein
MDRMEAVERLPEGEQYPVDFLPRQVPKDSAGQYFAVEEYFWASGECREL